MLTKINTKTGETKVLMSGTLNGQTPLFRNAIEYKGKLYFCGSVGGGGIGFCPACGRWTRRLTNARSCMQA